MVAAPFIGDLRRLIFVPDTTQFSFSGLAAAFHVPMVGGTPCDWAGVASLPLLAALFMVWESHGTGPRPACTRPHGWSARHVSRGDIFPDTGGLQHHEPESLGIQRLKHEGPAMFIARPVLNKKALPVGRAFYSAHRDLQACLHVYLREQPRPPGPVQPALAVGFDSSETGGGLTGRGPDPRGGRVPSSRGERGSAPRGPDAGACPACRSQSGRRHRSEPPSRSATRGTHPSQRRCG